MKRQVFATKHKKIFFLVIFPLSQEWRNFMVNNFIFITLGDLNLYVLMGAFVAVGARNFILKNIFLRFITVIGIHVEIKVSKKLGTCSNTCLGDSYDLRILLWMQSCSELTRAFVSMLWQYKHYMIDLFDKVVKTSLES